MKDLKVGDSLYKYLQFCGTVQYIVIRKITSTEEDATNKISCCLYEVECQSCQGHEKCTLLINKVKDKECFKFVEMTNNNGENDEKQDYWHNDSYFYSDKKTPKIEYITKRIQEIKEDIKGHNRQIKKLYETIEECEKTIEETQREEQNNGN